MEKNTSQSRPPIVTILGHVDHGKTTLLDAVRKTNVASKEAGGITQSIGASLVTTKDGKKITFIDTPGHAAFSKMRSRGAKVADIAILVVAGDDGVKPQTLESLSFIKEAAIPFIVAITKIDLPTAQPEVVLAQLEKEGVYFEGRGGNVPWAVLSAKSGKGIEELLELISLVSEVNEVRGDPEGELEAVVIETSKDVRGLLVSVVVRNGSLEVGKTIFSLNDEVKIRGLFVASGPVKKILPGEPALVLGFNILPEVGTQISSKATLEEANKTSKKVSLKVPKGLIPVAIKARNAGGLEAVLANLPQGVFIISSGVGDIFESDILDAKASGAKFILAFESKASASVSKLAESEGVKIIIFDVIYELFQKVEELVKGGQVEILGKAEILATFPFNDKKVAGCKVTEGKISKSDKLLVKRGEKEMGTVKIVTLKKGKVEISEAKAGEECGILFEPQLDFIIGDMLVSVRNG